MDYWTAHPGLGGAILLLGLAVFPRISMLLIGTPLSLLGWVGCLFAPHLTVAVLASMWYWDTNPFLVIVAWFFALVGTGGEGAAATGVGR